LEWGHEIKKVGNTVLAEPCESIKKEVKSCQHENTVPNLSQQESSSLKT